MPRFHLIRHAQSQNNTLRLDLGEEYNNSARHIRPLDARKRHPDPSITKLGEEQAAHLRSVLNSLCVGKTLVVCSPFIRAIQTIAPSLAWLRSELRVVLLCH